MKPRVEFVITEDATQSLLEPFHPIISTAVAKVFAEWEANVLPLIPQFTEGTQSGFIQNALERELRTHLGARPDVKFSLVGADRFWIRIKETILVRFKKINEAGTTSNVRTTRSDLFDRQQKLADVPDMPRITIGYRLAIDNSKIVALWVALFNGAKRLWHYELVTDVAGVVSIAPTPSGDLLADGVKLKSTAKKKKTSIA